ncbi:hypothetical protein NPIL_534291 [Nephila pilipes]|uniref:Uncharacterized protein n=1 Tax=Nephila pilipes TaxID=299642 RepID=A0A8X6MJL8_NEPPI|nr:hypothetical protein NPIL_534291 [Nephila pilipes]
MTNVEEIVKEFEDQAESQARNGCLPLKGDVLKIMPVQKRTATTERTMLKNYEANNREHEEPNTEPASSEQTKPLTEY